MKRLVMIVLPCIIMLVLLWGYVPMAKELIGKFENLGNNFKINNINKTSVSRTEEQNEKEDEVSLIVDNEKDQTLNSQDNSGDKTNVYRIVRQYNGKLGIFLPDTPLVPERIIDVDISTLPPEDKQMFEKGFVVNSHTQLVNLIEDYTS